MKSSTLRRTTFAGALIALTFSLPAFAADHVNIVDGLALRGFDPVAFFTQGHAVMGDPQFTAKYEGATYEFADAADKAAFEADPAKYVPQYGGFCAAATSHGAKVDADPHAFVIRDGHLYVNYNQEALQAFSKDLPVSIKAADEKWPQVREIEKVIR